MSAKLYKNYLALVAAEMCGKILVFAAYAYLARMLGPENFGAAEWAAAAVMCAGLLVDQGLSSYGAREIAKNSSATALLASEIVAARLLLAAISYALLAAFAVFFAKDSATSALLLIFGLELWALPFLLNWIFQGHDRMRTVALIQLIRMSFFALFVFAFVGSSGDVLRVAWAETLAVSSAAAFSLIMFLRQFPAPLAVYLRPRFSAKLWREGLTIGLSQMFWVVKMFGATVIVGLLAAPDETGFFAAAMRVLIALHAFVWLYYLNLLPSLARAHQTGNEAINAVINRSMRIVAPVSILIAVVWAALAPFAVQIAYGEKFAPTGAPLQLMAVVFAAAAISGHYRFGLIAAGRQTDEMLTAFFGAILAIIFLPVGVYANGATGAAAGLVAAEIAVLLASRFFARRAFSINEKANAGVMPIVPEAN